MTLTRKVTLSTAWGCTILSCSDFDSAFVVASVAIFLFKSDLSTNPEIN